MDVRWSAGDSAVFSCRTHLPQEKPVQMAGRCKRGEEERDSCRRGLDG